MQRHIENPLANRILAGEFSHGDTVHVDVDVDTDGVALAFTVTSAKEAVAA